MVITFHIVQRPLFISRLIECVQSGHSWSADLYLRILLAIDSEVVDRQVVHSQEVCSAKYVHLGEYMKPKSYPFRVGNHSRIDIILIKILHGDDTATYFKPKDYL